MDDDKLVVKTLCWKYVAKKCDKEDCEECEDFDPVKIEVKELHIVI